MRVAGAPGLALPASRVTAPVLATLAAFACLLALLAAGSDRGALPAPAEPRLEGAIVKAPLAFEPNAGRTDRRVDFMAHSVLGGTLYLGSGQAVLSLPQSGGTTRSVTVGFEGADPHAEAAGRSKLVGTANSFIGTDKSRWRSGLPTYERVRYRHVYPGIDVDFYGNQRDLEYDFRLAPGADPSQIAISHRGADSVRLTRAGDLAIAVGDTTVRQRAPVAYQRIDGERRIVDSAYELTGRTVGFRLGAYDSSRPLVIDPVVLAYSTFVGGSGTERAFDIAVDSAGAAYVTGDTQSSTDFPTQDPFQADSNGGDHDVVVTKLNPDTGGAMTLAYSTYLGGTDDDIAEGIAVDSAGAAYVTGVRPCQRTSPPRTSSRRIRPTATPSSPSSAPIPAAP